jgi:hypothetical protein
VLLYFDCPLDDLPADLPANQWQIDACQIDCDVDDGHIRVGLPIVDLEGEAIATARPVFGV